jgi:hypothetical protein
VYIILQNVYIFFNYGPNIYFLSLYSDVDYSACLILHTFLLGNSVKNVGLGTLSISIASNIITFKSQKKEKRKKKESFYPFLRICRLR